MIPPRQIQVAAAVALTLGVVLSGCAQDTPATTDKQLSETITAEGVLLAEILLSTADIEASVAEGLVTPDEVDDARQSMRDGTLKQWRELDEK